MSDISPTGPSSGSHYKTQFHVNEPTRQCWQRFFHNQASDQEIGQANDNFINMTSDAFNQMGKTTLKKMKEDEKQEKEAQGD